MGPIWPSGPSVLLCTEPGSSGGKSNPFPSTRRRPTVDHSLVAGGAQRQWLQACLPKANHRFPLASFSAFLATARRAPHRGRSLRGGSGRVAPSRLRQPPRPTIPSRSGSSRSGSDRFTSRSGSSRSGSAARAARAARGQTDLEVFVEKLLNRSDLAPRSSGKEDSRKLETFQMEPCG